MRSFEKKEVRWSPLEVGAGCGWWKLMRSSGDGRWSGPLSPRTHPRLLIGQNFSWSVRATDAKGPFCVGPSVLAFPSEPRVGAGVPVTAFFVRLDCPRRVLLRSSAFLLPIPGLQASVSFWVKRTVVLWWGQCLSICAGQSPAPTKRRPHVLADGGGGLGLGEEYLEVNRKT